LGDELCLADGRRATVSAARREDAPDDQPFRTYNLSVDEGRTYFAGRLGAWVHNTGGAWETTCKLVSVEVRKQVDAAPNLTDDAVLQLIEEAIKKHGDAADADAFTRKKHLRDVVEYLTNPNDPALPNGRRESLLEAIDRRFDGSRKTPRVGSSHPSLPIRKNPSDPTHGILNDKKVLVSGAGGGDALDVFRSRMSSLSEDAVRSLKHVEGHAVAEMARNNLAESVLHINYKTGPCRFCRKGIPELLREGQKLWVVFPDGIGYFTNKGWFPQ
ncbi:MAG: DddA-like double-stranded DNA deaminase toxin, partial [Planctomycetia bacterium]